MQTTESDLWWPVGGSYYLSDVLRQLYLSEVRTGFLDETLVCFSLLISSRSLETWSLYMIVETLLREYRIASAAIQCWDNWTNKITSEVRRRVGLATAHWSSIRPHVSTHAGIWSFQRLEGVPADFPLLLHMSKLYWTLVPQNSGQRSYR